MFPMISDLNELQLAKEIFHEVQADFKQEGIAFDDKMKVGIMVEVPSVAVMAHQFAKYVDFFSIGTNDLVQFTLAVDRGNEQIAHLYKPWHPAILHLIKHTVDAANSEGIHVGVCGEFAGNPLATLLLIGLGVQELSSSPSRIPQVKKIIRSASFEECENLAHKVMDFDTSSDVYDFLLRYMKKRFADMPIWFGNNS